MIKARHHAGFGASSDDPDRSASRPTQIGVAQLDGIYHAYALKAAAAREVLLEIKGVFLSAPTRYSVQIDHNLHVAPPIDLAPDDQSEEYRWRFLNHSCRPNAAFRANLLVAIIPITKAEEV